MDNTNTTTFTRALCECGNGKPLCCQGVCVDCRVKEEIAYRAENGLVKGARAVGRVCGTKFHILVAKTVAWGGVMTMRWVPKCQTGSRMYGSNEKDATVDCKRCC